MNIIDTEQPASTELTRFNALKHGILSRHTVLPWEDPDEYRQLLDALTSEHLPQGPTEEHLVEELAGILWRKCRLRMAENAAHRRGLEKSFDSYRNTAQVALAHLSTSAGDESAAKAVQSTNEDTAAASADIDEDEAMACAALKLLGSKRNDAYEAAVEALSVGIREWWVDELEYPSEEETAPDTGYSPEGESLRRFLEGKVMPWFESRRQELGRRHLIREQAFGESLDPDKHDKLVRYEVHLDRKLERTLAMLLKLKDLRIDGGDR